MSEKNQNPLTDNIGGGDDSQNRIEVIFVVTKQTVEYDTADSFEFLTFETFLASVPEHKKKFVEDQIDFGICVSQNNIDDVEDGGYLPGSVHFQKTKAVKVGDEYFVLQRVI